jgi:prolyl oligopeptidase
MTDLRISRGCALGVAGLALWLAAAGEPPKYPATKVEVVSDTIHGVKVDDPYRWLENTSDSAVQAWTDVQNALTRSVLDQNTALRKSLADRLHVLYAMPTLSAPRICGDKLLYTRRAGDQNHAVVLLADSIKADETNVVLNPNDFSTDGTVAMDWWFPSPDGSLIAFGRSADGSERSTLYLRDTKSTKDTMLVIPNTRACTVAWDKSGAGFLYTRYPQADSVPKGEEVYHRHVYYHKFGTDPKDDPRVFGEGAAKEQWHTAYSSGDFAYQFITASLDWAKNDLHMRKSGEKEFVPVAVSIGARVSGDVHDGKLYLLTDLDAPRYRIMVADVASPGRDSWKELIPQQAGVIESMTLAGGKLVLSILDDASSRLAVYNLDGTLDGKIELPTLGTVTGVSGRADKSEVHFSFESFAYPPSIFKYHVTDKVRESVFSPPMSVDVGKYSTKLEWATSKDGTKVPMFIVRRSDVAAEGKPAATLLYGYGGFNISVTPRFSQALFPWLDAGGVYVSACLRGGGEMGKSWHEAGRKDKKQNVFDDMIAAAETLIARNVTTPDRLAVRGGSNGGLLMGAIATQRPELFRVVHCAVPLLDMVRYHNFSIARLWIPEYGSAEDAEQFKTLLAYSPYHHVKKGVKYPAMLISTAESDTRVDPMHARKMAALLQANSASQHPILLWVEKKAGHGAGKPLRMRIEEQVDYLVFFLTQLQMTTLSS